MNNGVIITGGARGIGRHMVDLFTARGDVVVVFDILPERPKTVPQDVGYYAVDISVQEQVIAAFAYAHDYFSSQGASLVTLINNAGISRDALAVRVTEEQWHMTLNVNLTGTFWCAQQAITAMLRARPVMPRYIISLSSVVGLYGNPGQAAYSTSKAGINGLTKTLAREYGRRGIRVNAIAPGFIQTEMTAALGEAVADQAQARTALAQLGTVSDVGNLALFLSSGNADYITGQIISVDGGL